MNGSHSTSSCSCSIASPSFTFRRRAVDDLITLPVAPFGVMHDQRTAAVHDHEVASLACTTCKPWNLTVPALRASCVDCSETRRRAADVERAHRELSARLANRLRRNNANGLTDLDHLAGGEVAAVALHADTATRFARQHGANLDLLDARILDFAGEVFVDLVVDVDDRVALERIGDPLQRHAADDAVAQRLDVLAAFDDGPRLDAVAECRSPVR